MTKAELLEFLEPFTDDIRLITPDGLDIVSAKYIMSSDGEGMIVLSDDSKGG